MRSYHSAWHGTSISLTLVYKPRDLAVIGTKALIRCVFMEFTFHTVLHIQVS